VFLNLIRNDRRITNLYIIISNEFKQTEYNRYINHNPINDWR
jgi:hypothetical protein